MGEARLKAQSPRLSGSRFRSLHSLARRLQLPICSWCVSELLWSFVNDRLLRRLSTLHGLEIGPVRVFVFLRAEFGARLGINERVIYSALLAQAHHCALVNL